MKKTKDPYFPTRVSGINPQTGKKETYNFRGTDSGFEKGEKKEKALKKRGFTEVNHSGQTHLNTVVIGRQS